MVRHLADRPGKVEYFITQPNDSAMLGVVKVVYPKDQRGPINCHAHAVEIDRAIRNGVSHGAPAPPRSTFRDMMLQEVLREGKNGWLVDFFAHKELAARLEEALAQRKSLQNLRRAARATAVKDHDLKRRILPRWEKLFADLRAGRTTQALPARPLVAGRIR